MMRWKTNIHAMVKQIPSFASSSRNLVRHIGGIASQLTDYERLQTEIAPLLMLVIWKSKISEIGIGYACDSVNVDEMKLNSRYDSEWMANIIVPNVLDFLSIQVNEIDSDNAGFDDIEPWWSKWMWKLDGPDVLCAVVQDKFYHVSLLCATLIYLPRSL